MQTVERKISEKEAEGERVNGKRVITRERASILNVWIEREENRAAEKSRKGQLRRRESGKCAEWESKREKVETNSSG